MRQLMITEVYSGICAYSTQTLFAYLGKPRTNHGRPARSMGFAIMRSSSAKRFSSSQIPTKARFSPTGWLVGNLKLFCGLLCNTLSRCLIDAPGLATSARTRLKYDDSRLENLLLLSLRARAHRPPINLKGRRGWAPGGGGLASRSFSPAESPPRNGAKYALGEWMRSSEFWSSPPCQRPAIYSRNPQ